MKNEELIVKAEETHRLAASELAALLASEESTVPLGAAADRVRQKYVGDGVLLRGLIEFSNECFRTCCYCGLRGRNNKLRRFRLSDEEIIALAVKAKEYGYQTVVLQSGEDILLSAEQLSGVIREIKKLDLAVTLSIGEKSFAEYKILREAGADRFLLRIETTDPVLYEKYHPGMSHSFRLNCLAELRDLGYEVGTGSLIGLPGQTVESLAADILYFQELDADMVGIGPLIPNADTPLGTAPPGDIRLTLRMLALIRLLLPEANIPATTAMETLMPSARLLALQGGANVVMPNLTTGDARADYALYPGKAEVADTPAECREVLAAELSRIGRYVENSKGFRKRKNISP